MLPHSIDTSKHRKVSSLDRPFLSSSETQARMLHFQKVDAEHTDSEDEDEDNAMVIQDQDQDQDP